MFKQKEDVDILHSMNVLTFDVFTEVLFGGDVNGLVSKMYPYENEKGITEQLHLREILIRLSKAYLESYYNPIAALLPFVNSYGILNPFKRNNENLKHFKKGINQILEESKDKNSVGYKIANYEECTKQE